MQAQGGRLILGSGNPVKVLPNVVRETAAEGIYAYTDCERLYGRVRDARLNAALAQEAMKIRWFEPPASLDELIPYPQYRGRWFRDMAAPLVPTPARVEVPADIVSEPLPKLPDLEHQADDKFIPPGGTAAARQFLTNFLQAKSDRYYWQLSYPSAEATDRKSTRLNSSHSQQSRMPSSA